MRGQKVRRAESFGTLLKTNRLRLKREREYVAERLGKTAEAINTWEKGIVLPPPELLPKVARVFGIPQARLWRAFVHGIAEMYALEHMKRAA